MHNSMTIVMTNSTFNKLQGGGVDDEDESIITFIECKERST
jgi:hypothetical protein